MVGALRSEGHGPLTSQTFEISGAVSGSRNPTAKCNYVILTGGPDFE